MQELENNAASQGAFNEETGEINWDCPCLGGMADGPCGEEFRTAFSCFIYSKEEPKGMDCIENFKGMQDCFRRYPDVYGAELEEDEDDDDNMGGLGADESVAVAASSPDNTSGVAAAAAATSQASGSKPEIQTSKDEERRAIYDEPEKVSAESAEESTGKTKNLISDRSHTSRNSIKEKPLEELVPKAAIDATDPENQKDPKPEKE